MEKYRFWLFLKTQLMSIHIPNPCHEDWDQMSPEGSGRFCSSCSKIVVDFTSMTDDEVRNYLLQHKGHHTCGRFYTKQLAQPAQPETLTIPRTWFVQLPRSRQLFYAVALFFMVGISSCSFSDNPPAKTMPAATGIIAITAAPAPDTNRIPPSREERVMGEPAPAQPSGIVPEESVTMGAPLNPPEPAATLGIVSTPIVPDTPKIMGKIAAPPSPPPAPLPGQGPVPPAKPPAPQQPPEPEIKGYVQLEE